VDGERRVAFGEGEFAPISSSGLRMRSMGRRESEASPMSVKLPCCGASSPEIMRMVEPELPQSSGWLAGVTRPATPVTSMDSIFAGLVDLGAQRLMQASVEAQSAPVEKLVKREVPSAKAASIP
jgi:hypothetical protein